MSDEPKIGTLAWWTDPNCKLPPEPDSLDAAWSEAEAALPEGWRLDRLFLDGISVSGRLGSKPEEFGGRRDRHEWWEALARGPRYNDARGTGPTPAAALRALTAKLRERAG